MRQQKLLAAESKSSPPKASQPTASRTGKRDKRSPDSGDKMLPPPPRRLAEGSRKLSQQVWDAACKRLDLEVLASQRGPPCRQWFIHGCCFKGERCAYHHDGVAGSYAPTPAAPQGVGTSVAKAPEPVDLDQFPAGWAPRFETPIFGLSQGPLATLVDQRQAATAAAASASTPSAWAQPLFKAQPTPPPTPLASYT